MAEAMTLESVDDDEARLWLRFRHEGDWSAREQLMQLYRPYARIVAATYFGRRIDDDIEFDEYHQWALVGMVESIDRFDVSRGVQFKTFASRRMHGSILNGLECATEKQQQIAVRRRLREERAAEALSAATTSEGGEGGAAPKGKDENDVFAVLAEVGMALALGLMLEGTAMMAPPPDAVSPGHAYERAELHQLQARVASAVVELSEQEQLVIKGHYVDDLRFVEIAGLLGVSKGRVSQVHKQALEKLRRLLAISGGLDLVL